MKTLKSLAVLTAVTLMLGSCVESSQKYKSLLAERDSLQSESIRLEAGYNETIDILNDVEKGFAEIRGGESKMMVDVNGIEGKSAMKKQEVADQINSIKQMLDQNKQRIDKLQQLANKQGKQNATLLATVKRMQDELNQKSEFIASLQKQLEQKDIRINELNSTVDGLNSNISKLNQESDQQKSTIKSQDANINTVWYCIGTSKELSDAKIVSSNGLFKAKSVLDKSFEKSLFKQADLRQLPAIFTNSKKIKILSTHPKDSYAINKGSDNLLTIDIKNPEKFWSVSKYLVIQK